MQMKIHPMPPKTQHLKLLKGCKNLVICLHDLKIME